MAKTIKIEPRTEAFIQALELLSKRVNSPTNAEIARKLGMKSPSTISNIKKREQNIQPDQWDLFIQAYPSEIYELADYYRSDPNHLVYARDMDLNAFSGSLRMQSALRRTPDGGKTVMMDPYTLVPIVFMEQQKEYAGSQVRPTLANKLSKFPLLPGIAPEGAIWRYWQVPPTILEPYFYKNDILLTTQLHQYDWPSVNSNSLCVVIADNELVFCKISVVPRSKDKESSILLMSVNKDSTERSVNFWEVEEIWIHRASIILRTGEAAALQNF